LAALAIGSQAEQIMRKTSVQLEPAPRFVTKGDGKATAVTLDPLAYVTLLVKANVTDPDLWPPGMQAGAAWLARIREIERKCIANHGEFDGDKLSARVQNQYDDLCALLDRLRDTGERIPFRDYKARRAKTQRTGRRPRTHH
jgi:hypothetical protein